MTSISLNSVVKLNDTDKLSFNQSKKDDFNDNVIHTGEDGKVNKEDLLGALKDGNKEVFIKKPDGTVYKANVEQELNKLNEGLTKNEDLCIDFCVTETKTETKDLPPNMEEANKFKFKLSDGKDTKKELKEMGVNVKDGLDKKEVETIVNKLRAEGATQPEIDNFLKDVNKLRGMKKNDQTLDIKTGENKVDYSVEDNTVKKGPREKVRNGEFKLPGINVEKVRDGEVKLPTVNVEKVRDGEVKLPTVNVEKEGKFEFKLPKLNIDYKKGNREEIKEIRKEIKVEKGLEKEAKGLEKEKGKLETRLNELEAYSKRKTDKGECVPENITKEMTELKSKISTINTKLEGNKDCEDNTPKERIKELRTDIKENRGKLTVDPEKGKLELPKFKVDVEPGKLQLPKFKVEGEPGKLQLPKFKVEGEPGKLQLPKYERPKIKEEGFSGSVKTKEDVTTTKTDCETIGVDKTPEKPVEKPKDFNTKANNNYANNWVTNGDKNFFTTEEANKPVEGQDYTYKEATLQAFNAGASIEIKCSGDRNHRDALLKDKGLNVDCKLKETKHEDGSVTFTDNKNKSATLTKDQLTEQRQSNLSYTSKENVIQIESSASVVIAGKNLLDGTKKPNFDAIPGLKEYFKDGNITNDHLSVGRGLEMAGDLVKTAFDEFKANNPGKGKEEFLKAYGEKEVKLTSGNDNVVMPNTGKITVSQIMALYDMK